MCQSAIAPEASEPLRTCVQCGADLTRWRRKAATPPPLEVPEAAAAGTGEFDLSRGILGALAGALIGAAAIYGFYRLAGFRFPLLGVSIYTGRAT